MFALRPKKIVCFDELWTSEYRMEEHRQPTGMASLGQLASGGTPAYVAAAIAKLGGDSRYIGKIGSDASGLYLRNELEAAGVEAALVGMNMGIDSKAWTGQCEENEQESGDKMASDCVTDVMDTNRKTADFDDTWLDDVAVYHYGSAPLKKELSQTSALAAARRIKAAGGLTCCCPNSSADLWPDEVTMRQDLRIHIGTADIVKVNEEEAAILTGLEPAEGVQQLLEMGAKAVVVTLGEYGCCVITRQAMTSIPGIRVKSIDPSGAGDSFVGAMLLKLAERGVTPEQIETILNDEEQVRSIFSFANKAGAMTTTRHGVFAALPTMEELERLED
ncbi:fructokinase [Paenibacillus sp. 1_12]|uniref:PfkB family carbohydrate kinase n=1 Tax=Paenibacillus sp. 1_12 TaxID=1566278 RepID=UPI0008F24E7C|nr:PfkB family carbohydrate kinase [Paenibacillus sp. 1_12]SFL73306.1 fructokinase [Paenibacillus sp. 1_12]